MSTMARRAEVLPTRGAAGRKKDTIHFVNARPSSETERRTIQKMVRAHVGKWISDQTKDRAAALEAIENPPVRMEKKQIPSLSSIEREPDEPFYHSSPDSTSTPPSAGSSRESPETLSSLAVRASSSVFSEKSATRSIAWVSWEPHMDLCVHKNDSVDCCECSWTSSSDSPSPPRSGDLIEFMGANQFDPFRTYPSRFEPEVIQASEAYCLSTLWPGLTPSSTGVTTAPSNLWFPVSLSDPTLFTAFLFGSLSHKRVQWLSGYIPGNEYSDRDQRLLEISEMETVKLVSEEMSNPSRAVCDAIILSVVCMAHNKADSTILRNQSTPFNAPLRRLQWLDVYGILPPNIVHLKGLVQMITLRGGLENIALPGLSATISLSDLVTASTWLTIPVFPFISVADTRRGTPKREIIGYTESDIDYKTSHLKPLGLPRDMLESVCAQIVYTQCLEGHVQGLARQDLSLLSDMRNATQHTLLIVPSASQLKGFTTYGPPEIIYEACRLAMVVYGVGVVLPLPAQSSPLHRLAQCIQGTLKMANSPTIWEGWSAQIVLIWILTLGGIAAENQRERPWYVSMLRQVAQHNDVSTWDDLFQILMLMPWSPTACNGPAYNLWLETGV